MATFLGIHDMGAGVPDEQMESSWQAYKQVCHKQGCSAVRAYYNAEAGRAFCLTEADSARDVQKAHDEAGVPLKEVLEVKATD